MKRFLFLILFLLFPLICQAFDHQHSLWTDQLHRYVVWEEYGVASDVNYAAWKQDRQGLADYLEQISNVSAEQYRDWSRNQQLAFLINAYNAFTVDLVLRHYPVESIKDIGFWLGSPWRSKFFTLLGQHCSLDDIEHRMLRGDEGFGEPRIHFALVCASRGCPALPREAYISDDLESQFEEAIERFLADQGRNRFNVVTGHLEVSALFDWYGDDFIGFKGGKTLEDFFRPYADILSDDTAGKKRIQRAKAPLSFLPYDWRLNDRR